MKSRNRTLQRSGARRSRSARPRLEPLETRTAPAVNFQFVVYGGDPSGFFKAHPQALATLQQVAKELGDHINNNLTAIQPKGNESWTASFSDPRSFSDTITTSGPSVPANTVIIYVAGGNYDSGTLMESTEGRTSSISKPSATDPNWNSEVAYRGQSGNLALSGGSLWGGSLTINTNINWSYSGQSVSGQYDFGTLARHELESIIGFGGQGIPGHPSAWSNFVNSNNQFIGAHAEAAYGGPVPLGAPNSRSAGRWAQGTTSNTGPGTARVQAIMDPFFSTGQVLHYTQLDWAALQDMGWTVDYSEVTTPPSNVKAPGSSFGLTVSIKDPTGDVDTAYNGNVTIKLGTNPGKATLGGQLTVQAVHGVAKFTGVTLSQPGNGVQILVMPQGLPPTSTTFNAAPNVHLQIKTEPPSKSSIRDPFGLDVAFEYPDDEDDPNFDEDVSVQLVSDTTGATFAGDLSVEAVGGVATFNGLTLDRPGSYQIRAYTPGIPSAITGSITVPEPTVAIGLQNASTIVSYAGVGFALNPLAGIAGTLNGATDDVASDYKVEVNWGDGSAAVRDGYVGTVEGEVLVKGSHIYRAPGTYDVTLEVTGVNGQTVSDQTVVAVVYTLPDADSEPAVPPANDSGDRPLADVDLGLSNASTIVSYAGVGFALNPITSLSGTDNGVVDAKAADYHVQVNWGDSPDWDTSTSLVAEGGTILVKATHIYQASGTYDVVVYVTGPDGQTLSDQTVVAVVYNLPDTESEPPDVPAADRGAEPLADVELGLSNASTIVSYAGVGFALNPITSLSGTDNGVVDAKASDYKVQVNWGDGPEWDAETSLVAIGGNILVKGTHIYQASGTYDVVVYVTGPDGQTLSDQTVVAVVYNLPDTDSEPAVPPAVDKGDRPLAAVELGLSNASTIVSYAGVGFAVNPIASISGTDNGAVDANASDYKVQVNWGDSPDWDASTTLVSQGGTILVEGSHTYQASGTYDVVVYVTGPDGQTLSDQTVVAVVYNES